DEREVRGLLVLLLLTDARRAARTAADGRLLLLEQQDRSLWDAAAIREGAGLVVSALRGGRPGRFALQGAIAAVHAEAPSYAGTDWPQLLRLYDELLAGYRSLPAAKADLLRRLGRRPDAGHAYHEALDLTENAAERAFLSRRIAEVCGGADLRRGAGAAAPGPSVSLRSRGRLARRGAGRGRPPGRLTRTGWSE